MEIICYACGRGENPENTLEAITYCQEVNPDWRIEIDLQITSDGEIVLFHDKNGLRTTGVDLEIAKATLAEVQELNAGHYFSANGDAKQFQVPTLKMVLESFPNIKLLLDVHTDDLRAVDPILALLAKHQPPAPVIASEYDHVIAAFKEKAPELTYGAATKEAKQLIYSSFLGLDGLFPLKGDILIIPRQFGKINVLTPRIVKHVAKRHKKIWAWMEESEVVKTAENLDEALMLESLGADGIFTEFPARVKKEMDEK